MAFKIYVPLSDVREDTIAPRYHLLGYAIINDSVDTCEPEIKPILTDTALLKRPFVNLTLGYFSGQAVGSPHVTRVDYSTETSSGASWKNVILDWCKKAGVSNNQRPSTQQLVNMLSDLKISLSWGVDLIRDVMDRLVGYILKINDPSAIKPADQAGKTTIVNNLIAHLVNAGAFEKAIKAIAVPGVKSSATFKQPKRNTQSGLPSPTPTEAHTGIQVPPPTSPSAVPRTSSPPATPHNQTSPTAPNNTNNRTRAPFTPPSLIGQNAVFNTLSTHTTLLDTLERNSSLAAKERAHMRLDLSTHNAQIFQLAKFLVAYQKQLGGHF